MRQYAAKLLFRYRHASRAKNGQRYLCEERIVTFDARSPNAALAKAKRLARSAGFKFRVVGGGRAFFESVGIMELMELGVETVSGEVWWEIYSRKLSGRRTQLVPPERKLRVFTERLSSNGRKRSRRRRLTRA
jgi:uncharacterized protein DUF4288